LRNSMQSCLDHHFVPFRTSKASSARSSMWAALCAAFSSWKAPSAFHSKYLVDSSNLCSRSSITLRSHPLAWASQVAASSICLTSKCSAWNGSQSHQHWHCQVASSAALRCRKCSSTAQFFRLLCGQLFPKHNIRIYCGSKSNWPFSWELYYHVMHSMVNIMVALQGKHFWFPIEQLIREIKN
jgi:hypothetical protein